MKQSKDPSKRPFDNPDAVDTDKESIFDQEGMETVDPIPVEELNQKVKDEKQKRHSKDDSVSEKKYDSNK
ncbi:hypothetical protein EVJ33_13025 [Exiguobacterium sp. SL-10]|jgi:hypothetical protein|uniref:hypothetical protein n=1 Tax=unclassified Exiguobacterium TaxID=2644629 RepID=UPI001040DEBD|nr:MULTISPECIES: hypothetical protein [unclassified Exiguobacterium]TCI20820.1 hypothetical protein EVJ34_13295 [Exiguobacterium sp. SL-9]TCI28655.1 hypothetical protein EVJ33_13025 [Exiguobacterium sp. SL-10]